MNSVYRWIYEHTGLCRTLLFVGLFAFAFYASTLEYVSFLSIYLLVLAVWFLVGRFIASAPAKLFKEPLEQFYRSCDPYPLIEEAQRQLARKNDDPNRQMVEINYAAALRETGRHGEAMDILEALNIDKFPGTSPYSRYVYYHNLCDLCYLLDRKEEGRIWHRKSAQIYHDLPFSKAKQELEAAHELMEAEILYYEGNYEDALRKVAWLKLPYPKMVLNAALLAARCHISLEEPDKARKKLQYIIDNGNQLYCVQEAGKLLEGLN